MSRKTFGSALRDVSQPRKHDSHTGRVSTVDNGGKSISVVNMNNSQLRNLVPVMPYGVASSPPPGLMAFVLSSGNAKRDGIVGVYDPDKPRCNPGDSMLYSSGGASVHCNGNTVLINGVDILQEIDNIKNKL